jgi:hypothetical protein
VAVFSDLKWNIIMTHYFMSKCLIHKTIRRALRGRKNDNYCSYRHEHTVAVRTVWSFSNLFAELSENKLSS